MKFYFPLTASPFTLTMEQILNEFGVKPLLLAAQVVNFFVLLWILKRFLYRPLLKVLEERKQKIAESLKNAEEIEKRLLQTEEQSEKKLAEAAVEAKKILEETNKTVVQIIEEAHVKASHDMEEIVNKGMQSINAEREKMHQEMREELAEIVVVALEKVTGKVITKEDQKKMIEDTVKRM